MTDQAPKKRTYGEALEKRKEFDGSPLLAAEWVVDEFQKELSAQVQFK